MANTTGSLESNFIRRIEDSLAQPGDPGENFFGSYGTDQDVVSRLKKQIMSWIEGYSLPGPVVRILLALNEVDGISGRELCELTGMVPPQVSINVAMLSGIGIISSSKPAVGQRQTISLTHVGVSLVEAIVKIRDQALDLALSNLPLHRRERVLRAVFVEMNWKLRRN